MGFRNWSLITGRGRLQNCRRVRATEVLPLQKWVGVEKVLAMLTGGGAQRVLRGVPTERQKACDGFR